SITTIGSARGIMALEPSAGPGPGAKGGGGGGRPSRCHRPLARCDRASELAAQRVALPATPRNMDPTLKGASPGTVRARPGMKEAASTMTVRDLMTPHV